MNVLLKILVIINLFLLNRSVIFVHALDTHNMLFKTGKRLICIISFKYQLIPNILLKFKLVA